MFSFIRIGLHGFNMKRIPTSSPLYYITLHPGREEKLECFLIQEAFKFFVLITICIPGYQKRIAILCSLHIGIEPIAFIHSQP